MEAALTDSLETTATISVRDLRVNYGDNMPRGCASRGGRIASEAMGQVGRVK